MKNQKLQKRNPTTKRNQEFKAQDHDLPRIIQERKKPRTKIHEIKNQDSRVQDSRK